MKPLDLLQKQLEALISARDHSIKSFKKGDIDSLLHETHMNNLTPIIEEYRYAIRVLVTYA